ncbi:sucrase ferredoxin [Aquipuribacter sp. SD81]|uniref:sucrase ferredoxin n=1 Tax=Aquipuribacter sp. SD81 TaxID=3127703 RepID=UPI003017F075
MTGHLDPVDGRVEDRSGGDGAVRCSVLAAQEHEPVEATAPHAVAWVGVVVPGSWPQDALERLPEPVARALAAAPGVRPVLLRPVGRSGGGSALAGVVAGSSGEAVRTPPEDGVALVLAGTVPGRSWLRLVPEPEREAALTALGDPGGHALGELALGRDPGLGRREQRPAVLVCTNGARDVCCALSGRPAAALLRDRLREGAGGLLRRRRARALVWESSHLGGHRFAPTAALLPSGMLLGGLGPAPERLGDAVDEVLAGRTVADGYRGRSTYLPPEQAAEAAVRRHLGVTGTSAGPDDVRVDGSEPHPDGADGARLVFVRHSAGRTFRVRVERHVTDALRPASCGADPTPVVVWETEVDADAQTGAWLGV